MATTAALQYLRRLHDLTAAAEVSDASGRPVALDAAIEQMIALCRRSHAAGNKLLFIGNGGSAGISSHMAIDFSKNGGMRALALNDGAVLTCLGNDFGYEHVFAKQIEFHGRRGDVLVAISSSGKSANILNAVAAARGLGCDVVTFSGFAKENPLRRAGDLNFYIGAGEYGFVEVGHQALLHCILDLACGWKEA